MTSDSPDDSASIASARCSSPPLPVSFHSVSITDSETVPEKGLFARPYVRYLITTRFKRLSETDAGQEVLWRRYREFDALRQSLIAAYPYVIVPPLPEKKVLVDVGDAATVRERSISLEAFLERCTSHPILCRDSSLCTFLLESVSFDKVEQPAAKSSVETSMLLQQVTSTLVPPDQQLQGIDHVATETCRYTRRALQRMQRISVLHQRQAHCSSDTSECLRNWSIIDKDLADPLAIASGKYESFGDNTAAHWKSQLELVSRVFHDYIQYSEALRHVLQRGLHVTALISGTEANSTNYSLATYLLSGGAEANRSPSMKKHREEEADAARRTILMEVNRLDDQRITAQRQMWLEFARKNVQHIRQMLNGWVKVKEAFLPIAQEPID
ncbi:sorting nexin-4-like [Sycon ciliatum]|uniref:sorting nexin-4-like n=1 Tax=Sycon ciliatum TaxID=27933 RepID=UPI0020AC9F92|eukprot:scpid79561/ scgid25833/ Sorting nexin-4